MLRLRRPSLVLCLLGLLALVAIGADRSYAAEATKPPASAGPNVASSASAALTLLETHCVRCHGGESTKADLDITTRESLLRGGENGPAIVTGKPDDSLLIKTIRHETDPHMPKKARKLSDESIAQLAEWVKTGAPYPRPLDKTAAAATQPVGKTEFAISDADRKHWAFQRVKRPAMPAADPHDPPGANPIDRFILVKLREKGLTLSPEADRKTLIRRVTFDLIGLPPTPAEIDAFVADSASNAYEKLIDRLLASPQYGERWGRHWLDLARFAETDGFEHDAIRPHAWRYRDYVIRSFNADKPYDRFVKEQLAGDELWPDDPDAIIATGFNLLGPDMVDSADQIQRKHNTLNDMTDTAALAFLGLTMGCARCHDHKFEPLSQRDYYALQACFTPAAVVRDKPVASAADRTAYEAALHEYEQQPAVRELRELEAPAREKLFVARLNKLGPEAKAAHLTPPDKRTTEQANLVLETEDAAKVTETSVANAITGEAKVRREALLEQIKKLRKPPALPLAMALGATKGSPAKTFVLNRGEYSQPGDEVGPDVPEVLRISPSPGTPGEGRGGGSRGEASAGDPTPVAGNPHPNPPPEYRERELHRRSALADWIASPANPLTARVMVNRIWHHHFGKGLVATPSDFGTHGAKPANPELLDFLASEFAARGWSIKQMHRLMLTAATYRQQAAPEQDERTTTARQVDPENQRYWRMNRLRLEGEVIRDSLLAIGGRLNPQAGGPGVFPPIPEDALKGVKGWTTSKDPRDHVRRSVYIFGRRNLRFPFLEVFDAPDNNLSCPARERSTTAPQALTLLNADEVMAAAKATADRLKTEAATEAERITMAYRLTLGRPPTEREMRASQTFLAGGAPMSELCRALFNLNEFVYPR